MYVQGVFIIDLKITSAQESFLETNSRLMKLYLVKEIQRKLCSFLKLLSKILNIWTKYRLNNRKTNKELQLHYGNFLVFYAGEVFGLILKSSSMAKKINNCNVLHKKLLLLFLGQSTFFTLLVANAIFYIFLSYNSFLVIDHR